MKVIGILIGVFVVLWIIGGGGTGPYESNLHKTPEELAKIEKEEREFQSAVVAVRNLKNAMNNPKSFELVDAIFTTEGTLCIVYRASNAFGGIITKNYVVSDKVSSGTSEAWNRHCANKPGRDLKHIRAVL